MTRLIGFVPDLHAGADSAPLPYMSVKDYVNGQTKVYTPTDLQTHLYDNFSQLMYSKYYDLVIVNGDAVSGINKGNQGKFCVDPDISRQVEMAYEMLRPIRTKKWLFVMGTPYHSGDEKPAEQSLAEKFHSDFCYDKLIDFDGLKMHVGHCVDWKGGVVETLARELGCNGADLVVRSHRHEHAFVKRRGKMAVATPCWEWRNWFGVTNGMYSGTDIGTIEVEVDSEFRVKEYLVDMSKFRKATKYNDLK